MLQRVVGAVRAVTRPAWAGRDAPDAIHAEGLRRGAIGLLALGVITVGSALLPGTGARVGPALVFAGVEIAWAASVLLRDHRTRLRQSCITGLLAMLVLQGVAGYVRADGSGTSGLVAILVVVWAGTWLDPWGPLEVSPLTWAAGFVARLGHHAAALDAASLSLVTVAIGVVAAEGVARHSTSLRRTRAEQTATVAALSRENVTDDLTGLGNRRWGRELLERLLPGDCVAMVDLDHFKEVNDRLGHASGDRLLQELGSFLTEATRGGDNVARLGGEEFVIVFPRAGEHGEAAAARLLQAWRNRRPVTTFSVGLCVHQRGTTPEATLSRADAALYRAKAWGRDGLVMAARLPAGGPPARG